MISLQQICFVTSCFEIPSLVPYALFSIFINKTTVLVQNKNAQFSLGIVNVIDVATVSQAYLTTFVI